MVNGMGETSRHSLPFVLSLSKHERNLTGKAIDFPQYLNFAPFRPNAVGWQSPLGFGKLRKVCLATSLSLLAHR